MELVDAAVVLQVVDELHDLGADLRIVYVVAKGGGQFVDYLYLQILLLVLFERQEDCQGVLDAALWRQLDDFYQEIQRNRNDAVF